MIETRNELRDEFSNQTERDYEYTAENPARFTMEIIMEISRNLESMEILESEEIFRKSWNLQEISKFRMEIFFVSDLSSILGC